MIPTSLTAAAPGPALPVMPALPAPRKLRRPLTPFHGGRHAPPALRISTDPRDPRRAVIGGTIGQVCAALEGMVVVEAMRSR